MANTQTKATTKYQEKIGLIAKSFKLKKNWLKYTRKPAKDLEWVKLQQ